MNANAAVIITAGCLSALGVGFTTTSLTLGAIPQEPWFQIESVRIEGDTVFQKRKVTPQVLYAAYSVRVQDAEGRTVCGGGDKWPYRPIEPPRELPIEFDEWVGDAGCYSRLKEGEQYKALAEWAWTGPDGNLQTAAFDAAFTR